MDLIRWVRLDPDVQTDQYSSMVTGICCPSSYGTFAVFISSRNECISSE